MKHKPYRPYTLRVEGTLLACVQYCTEYIYCVTVDLDSAVAHSTTYVTPLVQYIVIHGDGGVIDGTTPPRHDANGMQCRWV